MRRLSDDSPIVKSIQTFMRLLNDSQLRVVYAGAASVADYSCLAKTVREIDGALWQESEAEMKFRGLKPLFTFDLPLELIADQELPLTKQQLDVLPIVTIRVLGSCLEAAENECDDFKSGQPPLAPLLGAMVSALSDRLLLDGFKIESAYDLKPEDL